MNPAFVPSDLEEALDLHTFSHISTGESRIGRLIKFNYAAAENSLAVVF